LRSSAAHLLKGEGIFIIFINSQAKKERPKPLFFFK